MTITKEREIQMITDRSTWPGDTLCLKKRSTGNEKAGVMGYSAFGVLTADRAPFTVWLRGKGGAADFKHAKVYSTLDALIADGWMVD